MRHHRNLDRSKVLGFLHELFSLKPEAKPWLEALGNHLGNYIFDVVIADTETAKLLGGNRELLVNPGPGGTTWFLQEDKVNGQEMPVQM